jgi:hypothetical protein
VSSNPLKKMSAEALYTQIGQLIAEMPDLNAMGPISADTHRWLGRAHALVSEAEGLAAEIEFKDHRNTLEQYRQVGAERITGLLYRALATVETEVPASFAGAFIPAGNTFDAMVAATKIFALARAELLIVDPYLDEKILTQFALLAPAGVKLKLLCDAGVQGNTDTCVEEVGSAIRRDATRRSQGSFCTHLARPACGSRPHVGVDRGTIVQCPRRATRWKNHARCARRAGSTTQVASLSVSTAKAMRCASDHSPAYVPGGAGSFSKWESGIGPNFVSLMTICI